MTAVEVITSVQRRRRRSREEKLRIVAESARPSRMISQVARNYGIAAGHWAAMRVLSAPGAREKLRGSRRQRLDGFTGHGWWRVSFAAQ